MFITIEIIIIYSSRASSIITPINHSDNRRVIIENKYPSTIMQHNYRRNLFILGMTTSTSSDSIATGALQVEPRRRPQYTT